MSDRPAFLPPVPAYDPPPAPPAYGPPDDPPSKERRSGLLGTLLLACGLLAKFGKGAFLVLKGSKFLTTSASILVSIAAYWTIWGLPFALGFVALLFVHEIGHGLQMRREGIRTSPIVFVPFLGAVIGMKDLPKDAAMEGRVGLAGPVLGTVGALACLVPYALTGDDFWRALAFIGFFLNLFNLAPVTPLDGGRAMAALAPWMWFVGLGLVFLLVFLTPSPVLILIALFGAFDVYGRWKRRGEPGGKDYYRVPRSQKALIGGTYLVLLVGLALGMQATYLEREL